MYIDYKGLLEHEIDWNKWYKVMTQCLAEFSFDDVADICSTLDLVEKDGDGLIYKVSGAALYREIQHACQILIAMKETNWEPDRMNETLAISDNCDAYYEEDLYMAELQFHQNSTSRESDPFIRVTMTIDNEFLIEFILIDQVA